MNGAVKWEVNILKIQLTGSYFLILNILKSDVHQGAVHMKIKLFLLVVFLLLESLSLSWPFDVHSVAMTQRGHRMSRSVCVSRLPASPSI